MVTDTLVMLGAAWGAAAALQLVLYLVSLRTRNAGIVDVGWAASFTLAIAIFVALRRAPLAQVAPVAAVAIAWSLRLTIYLVLRGAAGAHEEGRYVELRRRWAPHAGRAFFVFFQAQALLAAVLCVALVLPFAAPAGGAPIRIAGAGLAALALAGEALADAQLRAFKRDPRNRGRVCDVGLWSWSRHPNYFFETCVWIGYAIASLPSPGGPLALIGPAIILASILRVTGIPATEAQALRSKGDAYRAYQARTSAFVPWPPRRAPRAGAAS